MSTISLNLPTLASYCREINQTTTGTAVAKPHIIDEAVKTALKSYALNIKMIIITCITYTPHFCWVYLVCDKIHVSIKSSSYHDFLNPNPNPNPESWFFTR